MHPILAVYIGDYPDQVLVTGIKTKECPKCTVSPKEQGDKDVTSMPHNILTVRAALSHLDSNLQNFKAACIEVGIKPIRPFWQHLPYVDIYHAITPDILHQLHQGVFKHVVSWLSHANAYGAAEIDAHF